MNVYDITNGAGGGLHSMSVSSSICNIEHADYYIPWTLTLHLSTLNSICQFVDHDTSVTVGVQTVDIFSRIKVSAWMTTLMEPNCGEFWLKIQIVEISKQ